MWQFDRLKKQGGLMDTNKIEKHLLNRELNKIADDLSKIGQEIQQIFSRYGKIEGGHARELNDYISSHVLRVINEYYAGYTTTPSAHTNPDDLPDFIKELVLNWAVNDFFEKFNDVESMVHGHEQEVL
jgi:hypothetical protein